MPLSPRQRLREVLADQVQLGPAPEDTWVEGNAHAAARVLRIQLQAESQTLLSLKYLDPGSGRNKSAIWHGAGADHGVFIPETWENHHYWELDNSACNFILSVG